MFLPLSPNQKKLVSERIASLLSLIEKYGTTSVTPTMLASKILAIEISLENEDFIVNAVETEVRLSEDRSSSWKGDRSDITSGAKVHVGA